MNKYELSKRVTPGRYKRDEDIVTYVLLQRRKNYDLEEVAEFLPRVDYRDVDDILDDLNRGYEIRDKVIPPLAPAP